MSEASIDDGSLPAAIDELLRSDRKFRRFSYSIRRAQDALRREMLTEAYYLYLDLEAVANRRFAHALATVAVWAFEQGRKWQPKSQVSVRTNERVRGAVRKGRGRRR
jgi:hypothetical protein